jgi:geranylgeranylglycerol-phosphate geranylgeranyltransferase
MSTLSSLRRRKRTQEGKERTPSGWLASQVVLFNSRRKWGLLYSLATVAGLLCVPGVIQGMASDPDIFRVIQTTAPLPAISLLIATGMYILNDLVDADLDKANGKKRPIPSGQVSKKQAAVFIVSTNGLAIILSAVTLNGISVLLVMPMMAIGIMYSAPRIALMDRFIVKTLSISAFYAICALLGITSSYGIGIALANPVVPVYSLTLLGIMIFISSTLNDLGDIDGDRTAKRRTIPVVIGAKATIRLLVLLASGMIAISLATYEYIGSVSVALSSLFALLVISKLKKIGEGVVRLDAEAIRIQHKRIFPLHMLLQLLLIVSAVIVI